MPLTRDEIQVIGDCLRAAAYGPFFPDWEFSILFGLTRDEVAAFAEQWPVVLSDHEHLEVAVNNSINHLLYYPSKHREKWDDYISVDRPELLRVFTKWREQATPDSTKGYFDRLM
ncbi:MAG: hypothetical protein R3C10_26655 [Pirellulales bacterium]